LIGVFEQNSYTIFIRQYMRCMTHVR